MTDLFADQVAPCPRCHRPVDKKHTPEFCEKWREFREKARATFEAMDWTPATSGGGEAGEETNVGS